MLDFVPSLRALAPSSRRYHLGKRQWRARRKMDEGLTAAVQRCRSGYLGETKESAIPMRKHKLEAVDRVERSEHLWGLSDPPDTSRS